MAMNGFRDKTSILAMQNPQCDVMSDTLGLPEHRSSIDNAWAASDRRDNNGTVTPHRSHDAFIANPLGARWKMASIK